MRATWKGMTADFTDAERKLLERTQKRGGEGEALVVFALKAAFPGSTLVLPPKDPPRSKGGWTPFEGAPDVAVEDVRQDRLFGTEAQ